MGVVTARVRGGTATLIRGCRSGTLVSLLTVALLLGGCGLSDERALTAKLVSHRELGGDWGVVADTAVTVFDPVEGCPGPVVVSPVLSHVPSRYEGFDPWTVISRAAPTCGAVEELMRTDDEFVSDLAREQSELFEVILDGTGLVVGALYATARPAGDGLLVVDMVAELGGDQRMLVYLALLRRADADTTVEAFITSFREPISDAFVAGVLGLLDSRF
jgi:hypothetical protein